MNLLILTLNPKVYKVKSGAIFSTCAACGAKEMLDMTHKLTVFILSQNKKQKQEKKEKEKAEGKKEKDDKKSKVSHIVFQLRMWIHFTFFKSGGSCG